MQRRIGREEELGFVLALVLRLRALAVGVDLLEAGDAARDFIVEENRNDAPEADDHPERSSRDRRPSDADAHHNQRRDEVACRLNAIQLLSFLDSALLRLGSGCAAALRAPLRVSHGIFQRAYSPVQLGLRFCENAKGPSMASFECQSFSLSGKRLALASSIDSPSPSIAACLEAWMEIGEHSMISFAHRSAVGIRSFNATTSFTIPHLAASCAVMCLAVNIMPIAILSGIWRGRRCTPPAPAISPTRGSGSPKRAWSAAMMMSQASAISNPPPSANPFTAAMIGLVISKRAVMPAKPPLLICGRSPRCSAVHLRSLPAENARSPAPVRIATHITRSPAKSSHTWSISRWHGGCSAFMTSGRLS